MKKFYTLLFIFVLLFNLSVAQQWNPIGQGITAYGDSSVQNNFSLKINIYPNPNTGIFTIQFPNKVDDNFELEIINLAGQKVYSALLNNDKLYQIDLTGKPKGIYIAKITRGTDIFQKKIVVR